MNTPKTNLPIVITSKAVNKARIKAHAYFDLIWQSKLLTRNQAYNQLSKWMKIRKQKAHIKLFTEAQCNEVVNMCKSKYPELYKGKVYLDDPLFYP